MCRTRAPCTIGDDPEGSRTVSGVNTSGTPDGTVASCLAHPRTRRCPGPGGRSPRAVDGLAQLALDPWAGTGSDREPTRFSWPGPWVAVLRDGSAAVAFGSPPGLVWALPGAVFEDVSEGYLIAPADVALWSAQTLSPATPGHVEALVLAGDAEGPVKVVHEATARAGHGLEGTVTSTVAGPLQPLRTWGRSDPDRRRRSGGCGKRASQRDHAWDRSQRARRAALHGRRGRVPRPAAVRAVRASRAADGTGHAAALVHIGGLRADIPSDGTIRAGDAVRAL